MAHPLPAPFRAKMADTRGLEDMTGFSFARNEYKNHAETAATTPQWRQLTSGHQQQEVGTENDKNETDK